jgi:hypothetical protein
MDTNRNTAAIYLRRSAVDSGNTEADAFSRSLAASASASRVRPLVDA